ncbi:MAG TPA: siderophore-interacting protein [Steroidobacteraceae bacterium]|jgi:NADPH-dependent ferric siderophore reductase
MAEQSATDAARPRKPRFAVQVKRIRRLTPRMVRVTFTGDELSGFAWNGPAAHIKLIFDAANGQAPSGSQAGTPTAGGTRTPMRTYTPRRFDATARELDVEFVIHGEGPASAWAERAEVGQSLTVAGPGRSYAVDPDADWYVLAGDDTAIPAICTILDALPPTVKALALVEVVDSAEEHSLETRTANTEIRWLRRGADPRDAGRELESAVRRMELPPGAGRIYVACESEAMRRIRRHLITERAFPRDRLVTRGYWRLGETDHPDRDYGEDVS